MPMNQFLFDHQISAMKADRSGTADERRALFQETGDQAGRIAAWRKANGLSNVGWPQDQRSSLTDVRKPADSEGDAA